MGKLNHSPGPWYPMEFAGFWTLADSDHYDGDDLFDSNSVGEEKAEANAKLASYAPEMLECIQQFATVYDHEDRDDNKVFDAFWKIKEIIKKLEDE